MKPSLRTTTHIPQSHHQRSRIEKHYTAVSPLTTNERIYLNSIVPRITINNSGMRKSHSDGDVCVRPDTPTISRRPSWLKKKVSFEFPRIKDREGDELTALLKAKMNVSSKWTVGVDDNIH